MKRDNAFTGLEAAIVLIAFVVVAAIFSYVMLGAGFFATQKAQEVTYAGVKQTTSNLIPDGTIYGSMTGMNLDLVQLTVTVPVGGQSQQLANMTITFSSENGDVPRNFGYTNALEEGFFEIKECTNGLDSGFTAISALVPPGNSCNVVLDIGNGGPTSGNWFSLEIRPPIGAPTTIRKTIPTGYNGGKLL